MSIIKEKRELLESFVESVTGDEPQANVQGKQVLDKDISELLLSDLETKILEILQEGKKVMRHSKRHILKTEDINAAFKKLSIQVGESPLLTSTFRKPTDIHPPCRCNTKRFKVTLKIYGLSNLKP